MQKQSYNIFNRQIAVPSDHGSWVFLLSPLLIGFFTAGSWNPAGVHLIFSAAAAFLIRQPVLMMVKSYSGRRTRKDLSVARFWFIFYALIGLTGLVQIYIAGHGYVLWLAIPGMLVFGWHLWLVRRREERHRIGVDILAGGSLSLAAPAAYWISVGGPDPTGWWLWGLVWFQTAASIVYAFLRLKQRVLKDVPTRQEKWQMGQRAILYSGFNLAAVLTSSLVGWLPTWLWLAYALQFAETVWGTFSPAVGVKPTRIGIRQLIISTLFTIIFILTW
jgi:hypothetical protein